MLVSFFKGMLIGIASILPGVSGGTLAVSMGIYHRIIYSLNHFRKDWRQNALFLTPIVLGGGLAVAASVFGLDFLFERFPLQSNLFFIGLILGGLPDVYRKVQKETVHAGSLLVAIFFFLLVIAMVVFDGNSGIVVKLEMGVGNMIVLFFVGMIAAVTLVVPGVSGSMVLMLLGFYNPILHGIKEMISSFFDRNLASAWEHALLLLPFGIGVLFGIVVFAKAMEVIFRRYACYAYWGIIGLILASPIGILLSDEFAIPTVAGAIAALILGILGFVLALHLGDEES